MAKPGNRLLRSLCELATINEVLVNLHLLHLAARRGICEVESKYFVHYVSAYRQAREFCQNIRETL